MKTPTLSTMLKLNTEVRDTSTGQWGRLTHLQVRLGGNVHYLFQPRGLNRKTGQPLEASWIGHARIKGAIEESRDLPFDVLGTKAEDEASGFKGTVEAITLHTNGCVHLLIQPGGSQPESGAAIEPCDFDIRRLVGPKIPKFTEAARRADEAAKPSPAPFPKCTPRLP
jgi:hypothetical protein